MIKSYEELIQIPNYIDRIKYCQILDHKVGEETFGWKRYLNQKFYASREWKQLRNAVIARDTKGSFCCDLAHDDYPILGNIYIHHLNPISPEELYSGNEMIWDLNNLICVSYDTHSIIHYGGDMPIEIVERTKGDTCPWIRKTN